MSSPTTIETPGGCAAPVTSEDGQRASEAQRQVAVSDSAVLGHERREIQAYRAEPVESENGRSRLEAHIRRAVSDSATLGQTASEVHTTRAEVAEWRGLRYLAEMFADLQQFRIACGNRAARGYHSSKDGEPIEPLLASLQHQEDELLKRLVRMYRVAVEASIRDWIHNTTGLGEPVMARLLGHLGHPRVAQPYHWEGKGKDNRVLVADEPYHRSISQLWSYCGVGDPARKRRKAMSVEDAAACGSPRLRSLLFVIAENCMKMNGGVDKNGRPRPLSPYRAVYDEAKAVYATRVERVDDEDKPWPPARQHAAALRKVGKEVLRDLWLAAGEV